VDFDYYKLFVESTVIISHSLHESAYTAIVAFTWQNV